MAISPTQRSLKYLRDQGYIAEVVEHWNAFTKRRHDLFGFVDIVAVDSGKPYLELPRILFVQTTTTGNQSARLKKIDGNKYAPICNDTGLIDIEVHGWAKKGPPGKRKTWQVTVTEWPGDGLGEKATDGETTD